MAAPSHLPAHGEAARLRRSSAPYGGAHESGEALDTMLLQLAQGAADTRLAALLEACRPVVPQQHHALSSATAPILGEACYGAMGIPAASAGGWHRQARPRQAIGSSKAALQKLMFKAASTEDISRCMRAGNGSEAAPQPTTRLARSSVAWAPEQQDTNTQLTAVAAAAAAAAAGGPMGTEGLSGSLGNRLADLLAATQAAPCAPTGDAGQEALLSWLLQQSIQQQLLGPEQHTHGGCLAPASMVAVGAGPGSTGLSMATVPSSLPIDVVAKGSIAAAGSYLVGSSVALSEDSIHQAAMGGLAPAEPRPPPQINLSNRLNPNNIYFDAALADKYKQMNKQEKERLWMMDILSRQEEGTTTPTDTTTTLSPALATLSGPTSCTTTTTTNAPLEAAAASAAGPTKRPSSGSRELTPSSTMSSASPPRGSNSSRRNSSESSSSLQGDARGSGSSVRPQELSALVKDVPPNKLAVWLHVTAQLLPALPEPAQGVLSHVMQALSSKTNSAPAGTKLPSSSNVSAAPMPSVPTTAAPAHLAAGPDAAGARNSPRPQSPAHSVLAAQEGLKKQSSAPMPGLGSSPVLTAAALQQLALSLAAMGATDPSALGVPLAAVSPSTVVRPIGQRSPPAAAAASMAAAPPGLGGGTRSKQPATSGHHRLASAAGVRSHPHAMLPAHHHQAFQGHLAAQVAAAQYAAALTAAYY